VKRVRVGGSGIGSRFAHLLDSAHDQLRLRINSRAIGRVQKWAASCDRRGNCEPPSLIVLDQLYNRFGMRLIRRLIAGEFAVQSPSEECRAENQHDGPHGGRVLSFSFHRTSCKSSSEKPLASRITYLDELQTHSLMARAKPVLPQGQRPSPLARRRDDRVCDSRQNRRPGRLAKATGGLVPSGFRHRTQELIPVVPAGRCAPSCNAISAINQNPGIAESSREADFSGFMLTGAYTTSKPPCLGPLLRRIQLGNQSRRTISRSAHWGSANRATFVSRIIT
jgi:hypothetical protein